MRSERVRFLILQVAAVLAFGVVAAKLWSLQVVSQDKYRASADTNRFRLVAVDAPRGIIYDRSGQLLVRNIPSFTVSIVPAGLPEKPNEEQAVLERLSELIGIPVEQETEGEPGIRELLAARTVSPYAPVRIADNVDRQAAFVIEEEHLDMPGVTVDAIPLRRYVDGPLMSHVTGYMGRIPLGAEEGYKVQGYEPDDLVGLSGLERTQEAILAGIKGQKHIEVDAFERQVRVIASQEPTPGSNIVLTVDVELQQVVEDALRRGMKAADSDVGVAIVLDPRTGEVLSLVSLPSYDNNLFTGGISFADFQRLNEDKTHPLVNHAVSGQYPPGSTFKMVPACAVLQEGVVTPRTQFHCAGTLLLPNKLFPGDPTQSQTFYCWLNRGHGLLAVREAIAQSCDVYFYMATGGYGEFPGLGIDRLAEYARMFGYGQASGIELSAEAWGLLPSDKWKRQNYGESWFTGDTYNAAIGQGYVLATPLQVCNATAAIANGGTVYRPQLIYQVVAPDGTVAHSLEPEPLGELAVDPVHIELVRAGMRDAVTQGTAWLLRLPEVEVAGKTGTAEYPGLDEEGNLLLDDEGHLPTHAWFTAFAPYDNPEIALVVFLEGGGEGSQTAVPVASEILRYFFGIDKPQPTPTPQAVAN